MFRDSSDRAVWRVDGGKERFTPRPRLRGEGSPGVVVTIIRGYSYDAEADHAF